MFSRTQATSPHIIVARTRKQHLKKPYCLIQKVCNVPNINKYNIVPIIKLYMVAIIGSIGMGQKTPRGN
uniref:Uncharacterized protein n=1 Tax=Arion vulgaris TaxID=1028688 RepID=A0A0B6ZVA4_9EUPU